MIGTLAESTYTIKSTSSINLADYAGKWLKIAIRAAKTTEVNSPWTDEDTDGASVNYYWIRIPEANLDNVGLTTSNSTTQGVRYFYDNETTDWVMGTSDSTFYHLSMENKAFEFNTREYADGYELKIVGEDNSTQTIYVIPNPDKTTYEVYGIYTGTDIKYIKHSGTDLAGKYDDEFAMYAMHYGTLDSSDTDNIVLLPYRAKIDRIDVNAGDNTVDDLYVRAYMKLDSNGKIRLILPDITKLSVATLSNSATDPVEVTSNKYNFTKQVTAQALVKNENLEYYNESGVDSWVRLDSNTKTWSDATTSYTEADAITNISDVTTVAVSSDSSLTTSDNTGSYHRVSFKSDSQIIYRIMVTESVNGNENLICKSYGGIVTKVTDGGTTYYQNDVAILSEYLTDTTKYKVYISVARIGTNWNGISDWSDMWYLTASGIGAKVNDTGSTIIGGDIGSNSDDLLGSTPYSNDTTDIPSAASHDMDTQDTTEQNTNDTTETPDTDNTTEADTTEDTSEPSDTEADTIDDTTSGN